MFKRYLTEVTLSKWTGEIILLAYNLRHRLQGSSLRGHMVNGRQVRNLLPILTLTDVLHEFVFQTYFYRLRYGRHNSLSLIATVLWVEPPAGS